MVASNVLRVLVPGLLLPAVMGHAGGWAVITLDDLPEYAEAQKPLELTYTVRQHGHNALLDLRGRIEATSGRLSTTGTVSTASTGRYVARITLPAAGEWSITLRSGFGASDVTLLPLTVVQPGASLTTPLADADRGRRLFVAKGCVTCHEQLAIGPRLEAKRFDVAYISGFLANPPTTPSKGTSPMPKLGLQQREIASLVAFLNSDRQVVSRRP
jgi:mono/diheme cytochrome c family protein